MSTYKHLATIKRPLDDGAVGEYFYHRLSRVRVLGKLGTPEFDESYKLACDGHKTRNGRRLIASLRARLAKSEVPPTNVYFVEAIDTGLIKIGSAINPPDRLKKLSTGNSSQLRILKIIPDTSGIFLERVLHERFAGGRLRGEWFQPTAELLEFIAAPTHARSV